MKTRERAWTHEYASPNWGPVLATAGGVVFEGGTTDRYFHAFDAATGKQLWQYRTNSGITGVPTTFEVAGVQYVAVQSGWGVDAQGMLGRIDKARGTETVVPQGGVVLGVSSQCTSASAARPREPLAFGSTPFFRRVCTISPSVVRAR